MADSCKTCRFWLRGAMSSEDAKRGFCRRFPPALVTMKRLTPMESGVQSHYPHTAGGDWCGEHQRKDASDG